MSVQVPSENVISDQDELRHPLTFSYWSRFHKNNKFPKHPLIERVRTFIYNKAISSSQMLMIGKWG